MNNCDKYFDLISAYVDDELTETDAVELERHIAECPSCRSLLETLRSVSDELSDDCAPPPAELLENVMAEVRSQAGFPLAASRKKNNRRVIIRRCVSAAACIALVIIAVPVLADRMFGASSDCAAPESSNGQGADMYFTMTDCDGMSDVTLDSGLCGGAEAENSVGNSAPESGKADSPDAAEDAFEPDATATDSSQNTPSESDDWRNTPLDNWQYVSSNMTTQYEIVISITGGDLPEFFDGCTVGESDDGTVLYIVIPRLIAEKFISLYESGALPRDDDAQYSIEHYPADSGLALLLIDLPE